jgi:hypothetical protein
MQQSCTYGSVRGTAGNRRSYRDETPDGIRPAMHPRWLRCSFFKYGPDILSRRALPSRRLAGLGARRAFHHGLLVLLC